MSFVKNVFLFSRKENFSSFILKGTCCYWFKVWLWSHSGQGSWLSLLYGNMLFPRLWQVPEGGPGFCLLWHFRCSRGNTMLTPFSYCFWKAVPACCSCCYPVSAVIRRCLKLFFWGVLLFQSSIWLLRACEKMKTAASRWLTSFKWGDLLSLLISAWTPVGFLSLPASPSPDALTCCCQAGELPRGAWRAAMKTRHRAEEGQRRRPEGLGWKRKRQRQSFLGGRKQKVNNGTSEMHQGMQHLVLLEMKISGRECTHYLLYSYWYRDFFLVTRRKTRACRGKVESPHVHASDLLGKLTQLGHAAYTSKAIHLSEVFPLSKFAFISGNVILIPVPQDQWLRR